MATAKRTTTPITKHVPAIQLTLTEGEADFLIGVLAKIGGSETHGPCKYQVSIQDALTKAAGYSYTDSDAYRLMGGAIACDDYGQSRSQHRYA